MRIAALRILMVLPVPLMILTWAGLFMVGCFVNSQTFQQWAFQNEAPMFDRVITFGVWFTTWAWTNVSMLTIIASLIGNAANVQSCEAPRDHKLRRILPTLTRGFFIFLILVTGQILATGTVEGASADIKQGQYFRFATLGSLIAFIVGYNPLLLSRLISKITDAIVGPVLQGARQEPDTVTAASNGRTAETRQKIEATPRKFEAMQAPSIAQSAAYQEERRNTPR